MSGNTLNQSDLIEIIQKSAALSSRHKAKDALNSILEIITECMSRGETVTLTDFGTFKRIRTNERQGRNPHTGEQLTIPAGYRIKFKTAKKFKEELQDDPTLEDE